MITSNERNEFFSKLSKIWQNFKDYSYFENINLSPEQINIIEHDTDQLLIEGYAGTGKSLTLLYKLINVLVQQKNKRILYVTFNNTLIEDTKKRLNESKEFRENKDKHFLKIATFHEVATDVLKENRIIENGIRKLTAEVVNECRDKAYRRVAAISARYKEEGNKEYRSLDRDERLYKTHDDNFILDEIIWIKSMGLIQRERYFDIDRIGRSKSIRLTRVQRRTIFKIYEEYQEELQRKYYGYLDLEDYALKIIENTSILNKDKLFDYVFVDEVQDLDPMQIYALSLLTKQSIVLSGDAKQRIYKKSPIKYEDIGLNIKEKGKRKVLNKNYRSTAEIVKLANNLVFFDNDDKLIEKQFVRNGERPTIYYGKQLASVKYIAKEIKAIHAIDTKKTIAIIHREDIKPKKSYGNSEFRNALERELLLTFTDIKTYSNKFEFHKEKQIFYTNAYDIKGLEFDIVFVIDFNKAYYPNRKEILKIKNENEGKDENLVNEDIADFMNREKKLLYVAMTRARDKMYIIANGCEKEENISNFAFDFEEDRYIAENFTKKKMKILSVHNKVRLKTLLGDKYKKIYYDEIAKISSKVEVKKDKIKEVFKEKEKSGYTGIISAFDRYRVNEEQSISMSAITSIDKLIDVLKIKGIETIDNRAKGGFLWVIGGRELENMLNQTSIRNIKLKFLAKGGRTSNGRAAWYIA